VPYINTNAVPALASFPTVTPVNIIHVRAL
jgi:hypothetical protein